MNNILIKINNLKEKLKQWEYEYYVLDNPSVSDYEFDITLRELIELENKYPEFITSDSPSQRVGGQVSEKFKKEKHIFPMLSLSNSFNKNDLLKFDQDIEKIVLSSNNEYFVEPKIDGLSISLIYKDGVLIKGITRGDGVTGEDVTVNVKTIKTIPLIIDYKKDLEVRGEIFLDKESFSKMNNESDKKFANARNAAAGTLRNLDSKVVAKRNLKAIIYNIPNPLEHNLQSQNQVINFLKKHKFKTSNESKLCSNINEVFEKIEWFNKNRELIPYDIDGIVIKYDNILKYEEIGYTSKFPKWATAYKFPAEVVESKLLSIDVTVGRTGRINYIANIEPVNLNNTMVSKATLHNYDYIKEKDIMINDYVSLFKAGEIIPKIIGVNHKKRDNNVIKFNEPSNCPMCNYTLVKNKDEVDLYCVNEECKGRIIEGVVHFVSRQAMNIDGLSEGIIRKFFDEKIINSIWDIYEIKNKKELIFSKNVYKKDIEQGIKKQKNFKDKSFDNLVESIEKSKKNSLERLIFALGIKHVGEVASKSLSKKYKSLDNLRKASLDDLMSLNDLGEKMAMSIFKFFNDEKSYLIFENIKKYGINTNYIQSNDYSDIHIKEKYKNKTFLVTGSFSTYSRNQIKDILLELYNSKCVGTITKNVDYVIAGKNATQHKIDKAIQMNIPIIEEEFWKKENQG